VCVQIFALAGSSFVARTRILLAGVPVPVLCWPPPHSTLLQRGEGRRGGGARRMGCACAGTRRLLSCPFVCTPPSPCLVLSALAESSVQQQQ
jgi:hypothetical protein